MEFIAENRRARFDYDIRETFQAGIEITGGEVKSAKLGRMNLSGSYGIIRGGEAWLINADIPPYQPKNMPPDYDAKRARRLLLRRDELKHLSGALAEKKNVLIATKAYIARNLVKIELGLGMPRKKHDKRDVLKKRAHDREIRKEK